MTDITPERLSEEAEAAQLALDKGNYGAAVSGLCDARRAIQSASEALRARDATIAAQADDVRILAEDLDSLREDRDYLQAVHDAARVTLRRALGLEHADNDGVGTPAELATQAADQIERLKALLREADNVIGAAQSSAIATERGNRARSRECLAEVTAWQIRRNAAVSP